MKGCAADQPPSSSTCKRTDVDAASVEWLRSRKPKLRRHCRGNFFIRLPNGSSLWFGSDPAEADDRYRRLVECPYRSPKLPGPSAFQAERLQRVSVMLLNSGPSTVQQTAERLFTLVDSESGPAGRIKVRDCLKRFLTAVGTKQIDQLTADDLIGYANPLSVASVVAVSGKTDANVYASLESATQAIGWYPVQSRRPWHGLRSLGRPISAGGRGSESNSAGTPSSRSAAAWDRSGRDSKPGPGRCLRLRGFVAPDHR